MHTTEPRNGRHSFQISFSASISIFIIFTFFLNNSNFSLHIYDSGLVGFVLIIIHNFFYRLLIVFVSRCVNYIYGYEYVIYISCFVH